MRTSAVTAAIGLALAATAIGAGGCGKGDARPALLPAEDPRVPERQAAWMKRLTVPTGYDPSTGFIVARRVTALPAELHDGPTLREAVERGRAEGRAVVVFATADRCGPCQQFKLDAVRDERVREFLRTGPAIASHIEVDKDPGAATEILGSRGIPITYWIENGEVKDKLEGQRSGDVLLAWLQERAK
jgi:hypothetical protein